MIHQQKNESGFFFLIAPLRKQLQTAKRTIAAKFNKQITNARNYCRVLQTDLQLTLTTIDVHSVLQFSCWLTTGTCCIDFQLLLCIVSPLIPFHSFNSVSGQEYCRGLGFVESRNYREGRGRLRRRGIEGSRDCI